jgi:hypothetical protein
MPIVNFIFRHYPGEYRAMIERNEFTGNTEVAPFAAVVTVPGDFVSAAIFEAVQGICRAGGRIGGAARRLRRG